MYPVRGSLQRDGKAERRKLGDEPVEDRFQTGSLKIILRQVEHQRLGEPDAGVQYLAQLLQLSRIGFMELVQFHARHDEPLCEVVMELGGQFLSCPSLRNLAFCLKGKETVF